MTNVIYLDSLPVTNLDRFFDHVTRELTSSAVDGTCAVSPPIPLRSGFGWYVGRASFHYSANAGRWWYEPYDRISDYYSTESEAADAASWHRWGVPQDLDPTLAPSGLAVSD